MTSLATRTAAGLLALPLVLAAGGCVVVWDADMETETRYLSGEAEPHSALEVRTHNGAVSITQADVTEMQITAKVKARSIERLDSTSVAVEYTDDAVVVYPLWPAGGRKNNESCSFEILVPGADGVRVDTSNGSVQLTGLSGLAELETSNGRVVVTDHAGDVWADTSNGRIEMTRVYGSVDVDTSNGRVTLIDIDGPVEAKTSNGRVQVELASSNPGPVKVRTSNGAIDLAVGDAFDGELRLSTSNGSLKVNSMGGPRVSLSELSKRSATLVFGESYGSGYDVSKATTSNGSVTLRWVDGPAPLKDRDDEL